MKKDFQKWQVPPKLYKQPSYASTTQGKTPAHVNNDPKNVVPCVPAQAPATANMALIYGKYGHAFPRRLGRKVYREYFQ